jgi:hypothetical protein
MASRVLTGMFCAQDCASVWKEVTEIFVLVFETGVCARQVVPDMMKSVPKMIFDIRIRNSWPRVPED